jgi:hypothetical protein
MAGQGPQLERYEHEQVSDLTLLSHSLRDFRLPPHVDENCALLGYYTASGGNFFLTFRNNLSILSSSWPLKMGSIDFPETSVRNYHYSLSSDPKERSSLLVSFSF